MPYPEYSKKDTIPGKVVAIGAVTLLCLQWSEFQLWCSRLRIWHCCCHRCSVGSQLLLRFDPWLRNFHMPRMQPKKKKKKFAVVYFHSWWPYLCRKETGEIEMCKNLHSCIFKILNCDTDFHHTPPPRPCCGLGLMCGLGWGAVDSFRCCYLAFRWFNPSLLLFSCKAYIDLSPFSAIFPNLLFLPYVANNW